MTTDTLHVMQASLQFSDPKAAQQRDLNTIYRRAKEKNCHVLGHTEVNHQLRQILLEATADYGYKLMMFKDPDSGNLYSDCLSVRSDLEIVDKYYTWIIPGEQDAPGVRGHQARGLASVEFRFHGSLITASEMHIVTGYGYDPSRRDEILKQWRVSTRVAARAAKGPHLSVLMGDVNWDIDDPSDNLPAQILKDAGWTSVFDEVGSNEGTHGRRQIDEIYTFDNDGRVSVSKVKVWPDETAIDHQQVSAWLDIVRRG